MELKQQISALMDGEVFEDESDALFEQIAEEEAAHQDWEIYHLIGDVLRQPEHIHRDLSTQVHEKLRDEPTVLAPRRQVVKQKARAFALSAAASVVAVAVVGWMSVQIAPESPVQIAMKPDAMRPASMHIQPSSNEYLMAHQEYSPSIDVNGGASYIRTVSYDAVEK